MNRLLLSLVLLLLPVPLFAQEIGTLTRVEGNPRLIRGASVLRAAEGVRVHSGDIIETPNPGFVQVEFSGGTIVVLGDSSRLLLFSYPSALTTSGADKRANPAELVLLSGWLKGETNEHGSPYRFDSPLLAGATQGGTLVVHATPEAAEIFVESGAARISEVRPDGSLGNSAEDAKGGQFFSRRKGNSVAADTRLNSTFLEAMPRAFRDTLPSRLARLAGKSIQPKTDHEVSYAEVQPWLSIGRTWRRGFVERFQPRLEDPAFRKAVEDHIADHPEWDPVLHPEDHAPKPSATPNSDSSRPGNSK
jgi:hypothetical protein